MIKFTIQVRMPVEGSLHVESEISGPDIKKVLDFAGSFSSIDLSKKFYELLPVVKNQGKEQGVEFKFYPVGNFYDWRLWAMRIPIWGYNMLWNKLGKARYMELYG